MKSTMIFGKYLVADADTIIPHGAVVFNESTIIGVGTVSEMMSRYQPEKTFGSDDMIVSPGFINAHGHGRGLTDFQLGTTDDVLEAWKYRAYPGLHMYYDTVWRNLLMLESGITTTMHNHNLMDPNDPLTEFNRVLDAYDAVGIRVAFAPTLIDHNIVLYGDRDRFMSSASSMVRNMVEAIESKALSFNLATYMHGIDELLSSRVNDFVTILHGPLAPQWCTEDSLKEIRNHAQQKNLRIHIHLLQTILQKEYSRRYLAGSMVDYLGKIGLLTDRTTCGHAIWLSESDVSNLASSGASVTTHSSCNLRIQSGLSPVRDLYEKGVKIGIGMDDKTFNDQKDFFEEIRLTARLHRLGSYSMRKDPLPTSACFRMATQWGAEILGFTSIGRLAPGLKADIILLDYASMTYPYTYPDHSPLDIMLYRGKPDHVHTVIVNGEVLIQNRKHMRTDKDEIAARLVESLPADYPEQFRKENGKYVELKESLSNFYIKNDWYTHANHYSPFYPIQAKK